MAFNIAYTYQLIDKYTAPIQKIIAATRAHTRYLKENQAAIKASNQLLAKMTAEAGKTGTGITRLANRSERLDGAFKALQHNNAFDHLTTQAKGFNDQIDRMHRIRPNIPGFGLGAGVPGTIPGGSIPGQGPEVSGRRKEAAGGRMSRFGAAASGLTGIGTGVGISAVLKQTAAVENAMIDMGRATDLPAEQLRKFEERFMTLSEQIGISTDKLAIMAFEGSKTGIATKDLDRYVKLTANASVAFEILAAEAGRALGSIKAKMGLNIDQLEALMDRVNFVADATSADGERMVEILERLSGQFKTLHLPPEIAAGFAGIADQLETSPELAASGMNMLISKLMESSDIAKGMFKDPVETIRAVFKKFAAMPEAERVAAINKKFGTEAGRFAIKLAGSLELFDETMKKAADAKAMNSMEREMQSKLKSLTKLWENMKNAVTNVMVAIGEGLAPDIKRFGEYLREVTPKIREFVREHPGFVKIAIAIGVAIAAITLAVPIVWALGAAIGFLGAPILIAAGLIAIMAARWDEWVQAGHPVVKQINSITRRVGRIIDKFKELDTASDGSSKTMKILAKAFDWLAEFIALPLAALDLLLAGLEKLLGIQDKIKPIGILTDTSTSLNNLIPPKIRAASDPKALMGGSSDGGATVNGTITVKAEPGTKAKVSQPNLPTGSNLLMVK